MGPQTEPGRDMSAADQVGVTPCGSSPANTDLEAVTSPSHLRDPILIFPKSARNGNEIKQKIISVWLH